LSLSPEQAKAFRRYQRARNRYRRALLKAGDLKAKTRATDEMVKAVKMLRRSLNRGGNDPRMAKAIMDAELAIAKEEETRAGRA